ncbi:ribonuclease [Deinococcus sp. SDU3-2]|uniref:Ribonuclease n=2 Tax=Deinococcus terrestris TaxID=2651870 RepID=A0A7X1NU90_9DEIO|nr:ribonuclease [Deinococcus terrestris]
MGGEPVAAQTRAPAPARPARDPVSGLPWIEARALPPEGRHTLTLIASDGPFPYRKDGSVFGNRERLLPQGTYREYTVPTPGEDDRGARRIVCAEREPPTAECYYTADHYASFRRIAP